MADMREAKTNWGNLPDMLEQGVETLPQLLVYQAHRFHNKVFHRKKDFGIWQRYTWNEVLNQVKTFAMGLVSLGVERGQTISIVGENQPEFFGSEYAAQAIGAKVVCLYPDLTPAQMEYLLVHSESVAVVCEDQEQVDKVLDLGEKLPGLHAIIYWDDSGMWKYNHPKLMTYKRVQEMGEQYLVQHPDSFEELVEAGKGSDVAVLCYTSGTTGLPKGCIITHSNLLDYAFRVAGAIPLRPFSQHLSYISPAWMAEQNFGLTLGLLVPFIVNFPEEPETVQENIREIGPEILGLSPRQWESLASLVEAKMIDAGPIRRGFFKFGMFVGRKVNLTLLKGEKVHCGWRLLYILADKLILYPLRDKLGLHAVYFVISGGSGMSPDVYRFFHAMGVKLRNFYGNTEMGAFTIHQGETFALETVGKWLPVLPCFGPALEYKVTDEGELLVRGGSGFSGYYRNPEATAQMMCDGWYCTRDAVGLTPKNELVYLERVEDMRQLSNGHRYPPQFIEDRLRFSPFIKDAITLGDQDKSYVAALINIDRATLGPLAEQRRIGYTTFTDLSQNQKIRDLVGKEIEKINCLLPQESRVKRFINLPKELDPDEEELTRSRKLRRKFLEQRYNEFISAIYTGKTEFDAEVPIKYQDGRTGSLKTKIFINNCESEDGGGK